MKIIKERLSLKALLCDTSGVAFIEFVFTLPFLILVVFGSIELTRAVQAHQKATITAYAVADLITQNQSLTDREVNSLLKSAPLMMEPFDASASNMKVIVTSVSRTVPDPPRAEWQRQWGRAAGSSRVASREGGEANIRGFTLKDRDQVVAVEVFYRYRNVISADINFVNLLRLIGGTGVGFDPPTENLYKYAFTRPRYGSLMTPAN